MIDLDNLSAAAGQDLSAEDVNLGEYLIENSDGTRDLRLAYPFEIQVAEGGGPMRDITIADLHFARPKAGYLDILAKADTDAQAMKCMRELIAKMTGRQEKHVADKMDVADFFRAIVVVMDFFPKPKSPSTGAISPAR